MSMPAHATRSRLSGMGGLSIVIEDESNMINLWDFGHNPAGFLADERNSIIRADLLWDSYEVKDLSYFSYPDGYMKYKADGEEFGGWVSGAIREEDDFALGAMGTYLQRKLDSRYHDNKYESPGGLLVFSKALDPNTTFGADIGYLEEDYDYRSGSSETSDKTKLKDFRVQAGASTDLGSGVALAALLGYDSFEPDEEAFLIKTCSWRLAGQSVVEIPDKLKLGVEAAYTFRRGDYSEVYYGYEYNYVEEEKEYYYFSSLRMRAIYHISSKLQWALFYFDHEPFIGFYEPMYAITRVPGYRAYVQHFGTGVSCRPSKDLLVGVEYHFRNSTWPSDRFFQGWGLKHESLNLGIEGRLSESMTLRGGFIRSEANQNPNFDEARDRWQSRITSGFSYQPFGSSLLLEVSYAHTLGKFKDYSGPWTPQLSENTFSLSFKSIL
jgi:hypothetical protein